MRRKCNKPDCPAPKGLCLAHASPDHQKCEYWLGPQDEPAAGEKQVRVKDGTESLPWTGEPFQPADIEIIGQRSVPLIIGMVGTADAGKTSYLGMLYTLLFNGKEIENWSFAGSFTLAAWETLAQYLKLKPDGSIESAPPTPANPDYYSLYHLALKRGDLLRDLLFADSSGEVFSLWSVNVQDPNAENARWIYEKSSAFIFMVDSVALAHKRGSAKSEIVQMAHQLAANLGERPVAVVWSKADEIGNVRESIKKALDEDLATIFKDSRVFEVSNFSKSDPDILCHNNNRAIIEYLLERLNDSQIIRLTPQVSVCQDTFFNYRGAYENK